jgi:prevent-host-death family protein
MSHLAIWEAPASGAESEWGDLVTDEEYLTSPAEDGRRLRSRRATLTYMGSVGVRALQQHASEVVRRAAAGEVVEITDRGRPVARLVPTARTTLEGLVTAGLARPARSRLDEQPPPLPARPEGPSLSDLLAEARQAER